MREVTRLLQAHTAPTSAAPPLSSSTRLALTRLKHSRDWDGGVCDPLPSLVPSGDTDTSRLCPSLPSALSAAWPAPCSPECSPADTGAMTDHSAGGPSATTGAEGPSFPPAQLEPGQSGAFAPRPSLQAIDAADAAALHPPVAQEGPLRPRSHVLQPRPMSTSPLPPSMAASTPS